MNVLVRHRGANDPEVVRLRNEAREDALVRHVRKVVDQAPPLSEQTRRRIVALLAPAPAGPAVDHGPDAA
jgi:hypothetical protein